MALVTIERLESLCVQYGEPAEAFTELLNPFNIVYMLLKQKLLRLYLKLIYRENIIVFNST
jgi:hypothetical protein